MQGFQQRGIVGNHQLLGLGPGFLQLSVLNHDLDKPHLVVQILGGLFGNLVADCLFLGPVSHTGIGVCHTGQGG